MLPQQRHGNGRFKPKPTPPKRSEIGKPQNMPLNFTSTMPGTPGSDS